MTCCQFSNGCDHGAQQAGLGNSRFPEGIIVSFVGPLHAAVKNQNMRMFQKTTQQKIVSIVSNTNESYKESFYTLFEVKKIQSCINNGTHS